MKLVIEIEIADHLCKYMTAVSIERVLNHARRDLDGIAFDKAWSEDDKVDALTHAEDIAEAKPVVRALWDAACEAIRKARAAPNLRSQFVDYDRKLRGETP